MVACGAPLHRSAPVHGAVTAQTQSCSDLASAFLLTLLINMSLAAES